MTDKVDLSPASIVCACGCRTTRGLPGYCNPPNRASGHASGRLGLPVWGRKRTAGYSCPGTRQGSLVKSRPALCFPCQDLDPRWRTTLHEWHDNLSTVKIAVGRERHWGADGLEAIALVPGI